MTIKAFNTVSACHSFNCGHTLCQGLGTQSWANHRACPNEASGPVGGAGRKWIKVIFTNYTDT